MEIGDVSDVLLNGKNGRCRSLKREDHLFGVRKADNQVVPEGVLRLQQLDLIVAPGLQHRVKCSGFVWLPGPGRVLGELLVVLVGSGREGSQKERDLCDYEHV